MLIALVIILTLILLDVILLGVRTGVKGDPIPPRKIDGRDDA